MSKKQSEKDTRRIMNTVMWPAVQMALKKEKITTIDGPFSDIAKALYETPLDQPITQSISISVGDQEGITIIWEDVINIFHMVLLTSYVAGDLKNPLKLYYIERHIQKIKNKLKRLIKENYIRSSFGTEETMWVARSPIDEYSSLCMEMLFLASSSDYTFAKRILGFVAIEYILDAKRKATEGDNGPLIALAEAVRLSKVTLELVSEVCMEFEPLLSDNLCNFISRHDWAEYSRQVIKTSPIGLSGYIRFFTETGRDALILVGVVYIGIILFCFAEGVMGRCCSSSDPIPLCQTMTKIGDNVRNNFIR